MASNASKARRKAQAVNRLDDLAVRLGDHLGVEVPDLKLGKGGDPELAQIRQMEATGDLLAAILKASGVEVEAVPEPAPEEPTEQAEGEGAADETEDAAESPPPASAKRAAKKSAKKAAGKRTSRRGGK